jgi:hypothetical protein
MVTPAFEQSGAERRRRLGRALPSLIVVVGLLAWLLPISFGRLIDADEGYLLMAARLISEGHWPYRDFFLTQAPLVPVLFAGVFAAFGRSWLVARVFAGVLAVAMGWLVYRTTLSATRRQSAGAFAAALFALNGWTIGWLTIVKGYGLSTLLLLLAVWLVGSAVSRTDERASDGRVGAKIILAAGLAVGLAASTRLYAVLVVPALATYVACRLGCGRVALRRLGRFAVGCLLGLVPSILCGVRAPKAFVFGTLGYHAVREYGQDSLMGSVGAKVPDILRTVGLDAHATYSERQWMGLAIVAILAAFARLRWRSSSRSPAGVVALVLAAASVLPNPFLPQYLCMLVPFLAIEAGRLLGTVLDALGTGRPRWTLAVAVAAASYVVYNGWVGWYDRGRFLHSGVNVAGIESSDRVPRWRIQTIEAVAKAIDEQHRAVGASWWPGYFVSSTTGIVVELANDFGFRAAAVLPPADRRRLRIVSHSEVGDMIRQRQPGLFVEGNWATYPAAATLSAYGYRLRAKVENAKVWTVD